MDAMKAQPVISEETESGTRGTLPVYQERSRKLRDRLMKAGERVFAESGFRDAHVAEIANRAGCSVGSFYLRFENKEAFFFALQSDVAAHAEINIAKFFADPVCQTGSLLDVFRRLARNTARAMKGIEGYHRALFELSLRAQEVWPLMRQYEAIEAQKIVELLRARGIDMDPAKRDAAQLAVRIMHGQIVSNLLHGPGPYSIDDPRLHEELALVIIRYLGLEGASAG